jgi:hypothetical protein
MPLLTTLLMYRSEISLEENMKKFEKSLTLNSLTMDETFVKNAVKNGTMHRKAI